MRGGHSVTAPNRTRAGAEPEPNQSLNLSRPRGPYPASYYTGPLGTKNILPTDPKGALLILWPGDVGNWSLATWKTRIQEREAACGRRFDGIGIHYGGGGTFGGAANCAWINLADGKEQFIHSRGSIPCVSWSPSASIAQINSGGGMCASRTSPTTSRASASASCCGCSGSSTAPGCPGRQPWDRRRPGGRPGSGWSDCSTRRARPTSASGGLRPPGSTSRSATPAIRATRTSTGWAQTGTTRRLRPCRPHPYTRAGSSSGRCTTRPVTGVPRVSIHNQFGPRKPFVVGETGSLYDAK